VDEEERTQPMRKKAIPSKFVLGKEDKRNLILLLAIGIASRLYAFCAFFMISNDGAFQYIPVARLFYKGEYLQALQQPQLPLFPFLISILTHLTGNFELAGQLISIIFSLAALFPIYWIGRSFFGPKAAFWTAILYLLNPLMLHSSVDVLKEGLLIFLFLSSVYCALRFLLEGQWRWLFGTVAFSLTGALVNILALVVLAVLGVWLGYRVVRGILKREELQCRYLWVVIVFFVMLLIVVMPGVLGWEFLITKKPYKVIEGIFYRWFISEWPSLSQMGESALVIIVRFIEKACPLLFGLALFGLVWRVWVKEFSSEERYLALLIGVLIVIFFPNLYASGRYHLPAIFLLYLWAGFGFVKIRELIERRFTRYRKLTTMALVIILFVTVLPIALKPQRLDKVGYKKVGLLLRQQLPASPVILTDEPRVAYYADGTYLLIPPGARPKEIVEQGERGKADYLVIEGKGSAIPDAFAPFEKNGALKLVRSQPPPWKGKTVYVYKMRK
jgi:hypothetical protein